MLWRAEVQHQAAQEGLGFPREICWRSSQGRSLLPQHSTARQGTAQRGSWARHGAFTGPHQLPTSILPTPMMLSHSRRTPEPQTQGSFAFSIRQLRSKEFPLPAPRRISSAHRRQAPNPCPSPHSHGSALPQPSWVPTDQGHLATGSEQAASCSSRSPNQEKKEHPGLISINKLCEQHTQPNALTH